MSEIPIEPDPSLPFDLPPTYLFVQIYEAISCREFIFTA